MTWFIYQCGSRKVQQVYYSTLGSAVYQLDCEVSVPNTHSRPSPSIRYKTSFATVRGIIGAPISRRNYKTWPDMQLYSDLSKENLNISRRVSEIAHKAVIRIVVETTVRGASVAWPYQRAQLKVLEKLRKNIRVKPYKRCNKCNRAWPHRLNDRDQLKSAAYAESMVLPYLFK